jgi:peptidoglycan/LPS O-acetylase OafA/YrhL
MVSWSLCVEEQFYFGLPLLFLLFRPRYARLLAVVGVILVGAASRWLDPLYGERTLLMTHVRFDGIGFGLLAALASSGWPTLGARLRPWARPVTLGWVLLFFQAALAPLRLRGPVRWSLILGLSVLVALGLYRLVEKPGLALRERVRQRLGARRSAEGIADAYPGP